MSTYRSSPPRRSTGGATRPRNFSGLVATIQLSFLALLAFALVIFFLRRNQERELFSFDDLDEKLLLRSFPPGAVNSSKVYEIDWLSVDVVRDITLIEDQPLEISLVVTVHNTEFAVEQVIQAVLDMTASVYELIVVLDHCTDNSRKAIMKVMTDHLNLVHAVSLEESSGRETGLEKIATEKGVADESARQKLKLFDEGKNNELQKPSGYEVSSYEAYIRKADGPRMAKFLLVETKRPYFDTKAKNLGLRLARAPYTILIQDNMVMTDYGYDRALLKPHRAYTDLVAVTGRCVYNDRVNKADGTLEFFDFAGRCELPNFEVEPRERYMLHIRDVADSGPLMLEMVKVRALGYFDEQRFYPLDSDDHDLCLRAFTQHKWKCAQYPVSVRSDPQWARRKAREVSPRELVDVEKIHHAKIVLRHKAYFDSGLKHNESRPVEMEPEYRLPKTVVTAASQRDAKRLKTLYYSMLRHAPGTRLVIHDIGLTPETAARLRLWQNAELWRTPIVRFPRHVQNYRHALKPLLLLETVETLGGLVVWLNVGRIIQRPMDKLWRDIARKGIYTLAGSGTVASSIPKMIASEISHRTNTTHFGDGPMCDTTVIGVSRLHLRAYAKIAHPWRRCVLDEICYSKSSESKSPATLKLPSPAPSPPSPTGLTIREARAVFSAFVHASGVKTCEPTSGGEEQIVVSQLKTG